MPDPECMLMPPINPTPRRSIRYPVFLTATCRNSMGRLSDIILSDLSEEGCGLSTSEVLLKPGQMVVIRMASLEGLSGQVVWVRGKRAGVKFERPLYGPVVEHLVRVQLTGAASPQPGPQQGRRRI